MSIGREKPLRRELRALGVAAAILITADLTVGWIAQSLTADAEHVAEIPDVVSSVTAADGDSVLFVGNSVTRRGIDAERFEAAGDVTAASVHPDDTTIADWIYLYDHFVTRPGVDVDLVVVPFVTGQLRDDRPLDPSRIGRDYTALTEIGGRVGDVGFTPGVELTSAYLSNIFGNRERLARRSLDRIPRYRQLVQGINDEAVAERDASLEEVTASYTRLEQLRDAVADGGGRLVVVAMPTRFDYDLDTDLIEASEALDVELVDLRSVAVTGDDFRDELHLNDDGAKLVTDALADRLLTGG